MDFPKKDSFVGEYMKLIYHQEFGPHYKSFQPYSVNFVNPESLNHWIEQWILIYGELHTRLEKFSNVKFVKYELLSKSKDCWSEICDFISIHDGSDARFINSQKKVSIAMDDNLAAKAIQIYDLF